MGADPTLNSTKPTGMFAHTRLPVALLLVLLTAFTARAPGDDYRDVVVPFFKAHCVDCHLGDEPEGEFSIARRNLGTDFGVTLHRQRWLEVLNVLGESSMPPEDRPHPAANDVAAVVAWISENVAAAELAARTSSPVLRRLNRTEYRNTIRDLVGIDFDVSGFPQDPPAGGFDNNGGALTLSPLQLELTLDAAEEILDRAIVEGEQPETVRWRFDPVEGSGGDRVRMRIDDRNNPIVNGGNNPHQGEWVMIHHASWDKTINARDFRLPAAGEYLIRVRLAGRTPSRDDVVACRGVRGARGNSMRPPQTSNLAAQRRLVSRETVVEVPLAGLSFTGDVPTLTSTWITMDGKRLHEHAIRLEASPVRPPVP